jgi:Spy/CpxP family protein refolding chaperone
MRKRVSLLIAALMLALTMSFGSMAAFADNPHAGKSGHFKGSATPCKKDQGGDHPKCPGPK